jgi:PAS domain S-box-containing protein
MSLFRPSRDLSSLRFRLPVLLMLYCSAVALVLYIIADRVQEGRFERTFESVQMLRATEIQSRTERAAERSELETGQREFGELGVFEELRAGVFVSPENLVILSSRREWAGRPLELPSLGLPAGEQVRVATAMQRARETGRVVSQFSADRNVLAIVMPAALPLGPGDLRLDRRALILLIYDLSFAKSVNSFRLRQQFAVAMIGVLVAVFGLGVTLHFFVTRRIEQLHGMMARFAVGEPVEKEPTPDSEGADEISHLFRHFKAIAATSHRVNRSLRTISNCNQVLVHAADEPSLLHQICEVIVRDGGYRMAWVALTGGADSATPQAVAHAGPWSEEAARDDASALALPLESDGRMFGILTIHPSEGVVVDSGERALLSELADDLAFGIQVLRTRSNQRRAEQALEASEVLLRQFIKYTPAAVAMFDTEMRYIAASDRWLTAYRLDGQTLIGRSHYEVFPEISDDWKSVHRRALAGAVERRDEDPFRRADGATEWLEWEVRPWHTLDGAIGGVIMFTQVITERIRVEQALRDSQSKLGMAMDLAGLAPWELDVRTNTFTFDQRLYAQFGTTARREGGLTMDADEYVRRFIPREDHHILAEFSARANATSDPGYSAQFEHRIRRTDGSIGFVQVRASYVKDEAGQLVKVYGANQDITERKRAAAEVVAANERYARQEASLTTLMRSFVSAPEDFTPIVREITEVVARTLEVAQVGVWRHDDRGTSTRCQDLFEWPELRHSSGEELTEESCPRFFRASAESDVIAAYDALADARTSELAGRYLTPHGITSMMSVAIRSQGSTVGVLSCKHKGPRRRWMPDEQTYALAVANLLSAIISQVERRRLEVQLRQAQKLEAIGQLAGGVAHDFNNILTVILGRTEEVAQDARLPADLHEAIADVSQSAERATALTRQLLAFSRRQTIQVRDVDMNEVVGNLTRMLNRILGEDVDVDFHYASGPAHVRADPGMIEQVLLNLVVNARDAMPLGGQLSIEVSLVEGAAQPGGPVRPAGSWVCLRVTDTGSGIAAEHLPHIFEPFFTTKDVGKGTGLGLATTYGIVQQHGGWIEVESQVDRGTTFRVFFPHVSAAVVEPPAPAAAPPSPRGDETILVVEDEDGVRALVIKVLADLGYRLLQAQSGPRAIEIWREHGSEIDMLITDIVMPDGMNGIELADRLRRTRPSLKVIFTSGYLADVSRDDIPARETDAYLAKPFSLPELVRLVRRTLDAREPTSGREASR